MSDDKDLKGVEASARDYIQQIQDRVSEDEEAARRPRKPGHRRISPIVVWSLVVVAVVTTVTNVFSLYRVESSAGQERGDLAVLVSIHMAVQDIEAFRDSTGRFPASLSEIGADVYGLEYDQSDSTFTVAGGQGAWRVVHRSADRLPSLDSALVARGVVER